MLTSATVPSSIFQSTGSYHKYLVERRLLDWKSLNSIKELVTRIGLIVSAPFVYLTLAFKNLVKALSSLIHRPTPSRSAKKLISPCKTAEKILEFNSSQTNQQNFDDLEKEVLRLRNANILTKDLEDLLSMGIQISSFGSNFQSQQKKKRGPCNAW